MGVGISCDRCMADLPQGEPDDSPTVWEKRSDAEEVVHVCSDCYDASADIGFVERTAYYVIGEENARMLRSDPRGPEALRAVLRGADAPGDAPPAVHECGVSDAAAACSACGAPQDPAEPDP